MRPTHNKWRRIVNESKHTWIQLQEHGEMTNRVSSWILIFVKFFTFIKDVSSHFIGIKPAWTPKFFPRKESKLIFAN